jgi:dihydroxyacetone kinase-like protein
MPIERVSKEQFRTILGNVTAAVSREKEHLSQLDSHIGDGDHGFGMANGFRIGFENVSQTPEGSIEDYLKTIGFSLIKEVGGASGTIFGSLFLGMAKGAKGHEEIALADFCAMLVEGLTLVQQRGKAQPGDKTMIDAVHPAVASLQQSLTEGLSLVEAFQRAAQAAQAGAEQTKNMIGKHGRAKYFREKSIGYQDAGATTIAVVISAIASSLASMET